MRVMLLVTDLELGGTPLRLARLAGGLRDAGLEVYVGCLAPPGPVSTALAEQSIATFACGAHSAANVAALVRLSRHVRRIRPDLIHATLTHANVAARLVGWLHRVPVITATATIEVERRWHRLAERLTARLDRGHIVNSAAVTDHIARAFGRPRDRVFLVPPSLAPAPTAGDRDGTRRTLGVGREDFLVLWAGRLDPVKRLDIVLRCAELLHDLPVRFLLAGDGPARPWLQRQLQHSPARRVEWLGWRNDLTELMAAADAFLFPSRTEGMPNAVLQAMAAGLPIVASNIPALRALAGDEERILLIDSAEPQAFADALLNLRDDPPRRTALGQRAAAWAQREFDPRRTTAAALRAYRRILRPL